MKEADGISEATFWKEVILFYLHCRNTCHRKLKDSFCSLDFKLELREREKRDNNNSNSTNLFQRQYSDGWQVIGME